ncbi:hypothetical protein Cni_G16582 [Canna indica]|uniref:Uncharacterized protein n=1 Tax=Canna indica TaxID=4628 RepID=A0AAQ3KFD5_9LILI|nr:hypothetical protein Cni_G16582 [Canna indica]
MSLHKTHSLANIPFSWENQPGISKVAPHLGEDNPVAPHEEEQLVTPKLTKKLPPPPCKVENPKQSTLHGIYVPLPPCAFQPPPSLPQKAPGKKVSMKEGGDPFLAAYMECTKSRKQGRKRDLWEKLGLSCRGGRREVREEAMVRLPAKLPEEGEREEIK